MMKQEAIQYFNAPMPPMERGKHLWIYTHLYRANPRPDQQQVHFDTENLLSIDGPGCFWCGRNWSKEHANSYCPGDTCR